MGFLIFAMSRYCKMKYRLHKYAERVCGTLQYLDSMRAVFHN